METDGEIRFYANPAEVEADSEDESWLKAAAVAAAYGEGGDDMLVKIVPSEDLALVMGETLYESSAEQLQGMIDEEDEFDRGRIWLGSSGPRPIKYFAEDTITDSGNMPPEQGKQGEQG